MYPVTTGGRRESITSVDGSIGSSAFACRVMIVSPPEPSVESVDSEKRARRFVPLPSFARAEPDTNDTIEVPGPTTSKFIVAIFPFPEKPGFKMSPSKATTSSPDAIPGCSTQRSTSESEILIDVGRTWAESNDNSPETAFITSPSVSTRTSTGTTEPTAYEPVEGLRRSVAA